jgi:hypothetical protein
MTTSTDSVPDPTRSLDRGALEQILGRPVDQGWPPGAAAPGSRVLVVHDSDWDGPWQREFLGTIDDLAAPTPLDHAQARPGELVYWVRFDESQFDCAGDGPYRKALIWSRYLRFDPEPVTRPPCEPPCAPRG